MADQAAKRRANYSKRKGAQAEREVAELINDLLGVPTRRKLGAGRQDDQGDIDGVPDTTIQVAAWARVESAVRTKPVAAEQQRINANTTFVATFVRLVGGDYRVVLTPEQWAVLWREATS